MEMTLKEILLSSVLIAGLSFGTDLYAQEIKCELQKKLEKEGYTFLTNISSRISVYDYKYIDSLRKRFEEVKVVGPACDIDGKEFNGIAVYIKNSSAKK